MLLRFSFLLILFGFLLGIGGACCAGEKPQSPTPAITFDVQEESPRSAVKNAPKFIPRKGATQRATFNVNVVDESLPSGRPSKPSNPRSDRRQPSFDESIISPSEGDKRTPEPRFPSSSSDKSPIPPNPLVELEPTSEASPESILEDGSADFPMEGDADLHDWVEDPMTLGSTPLATSFGASNQPLCDPNVRYFLSIKRYEFFVGGQAFSGPTNFQSAAPRATAGGSFGMHEGFLWSGPGNWIFNGRYSAQFGLSATQNHWEGSPLHNGERDQLFLTTGMFRRVDYGVQGGLVVDYLQDDWYYQAKLAQLRGELSFHGSGEVEWGFRWSNSLNRSTSLELVTGSTPLNAATSTFQATDTYRFFYRRGFGECARHRANFSIGFSEHRDTILDIGLDSPIARSFGLRTGATYLNPNGGNSQFRTESWAMGIAIVFTPGRCFGTGSRYHRPMFEVANNGSFFIRRK